MADTSSAGRPPSGSLLDPREVGGLAVAAPQGPAGAALEHGVHLARVQADPPLAAETGRHGAEQLLRQAVLDRLKLAPLDSGQHGAYATGDVEADAAGRDHATPIGVERGDAADRKAVAPVGVGQGEGRFDDAGQAGDVLHLFQYLVVHRVEQRLVGEDHPRYAHAPGRLEAPFDLAHLGQLRPVHGGPRSGLERPAQTSSTHCASQPPSRRATSSAV